MSATVDPNIMAISTTASNTSAVNATTPTPTPTPAPEAPAGPNVTSSSWNDVKLTAGASAGAGAALLLLFEFLRGKRARPCRALYRQRHTLRYRKINNRLKKIDLRPYPRGLMRWFTSTWRVSDAEFYQQVGMDGYVTLRFIRLCKRLCQFAAFFGLVVLLPIYSNGGDEADGARHLSMANLAEKSRALWAGVVFAWFFTLFFLYSMRKEFLAFSDLRNDWLAGGDVARSTQASYTVRVERIPRAFRSPAMLQKFFSTLFPGQIYSATVCLGLEELKPLTLKRDKCLQAIESALIRESALGKATTVRDGWCGLKVNAVRHYGNVLANINSQLRPKQEHKLEAAKTIERLRRKELRKLGESLENMALYFVDQLDRGGAEDEDGNARVSILERRGEQPDYNLHARPLQWLAERQQEQDQIERDFFLATAETAAIGEKAERGSETDTPRDRLATSLPSPSPWVPPQPPSTLPPSPPSEQQQQEGGGGSGWDQMSQEEEKAFSVLSPVAEETAGHPGLRSLAGMDVRNRKSSGSRKSSTSARHETLSRGASWTSVLSKRDSNAVDQEARTRLLEAEDLVNKQGEDYIQRNLDHARQISNLHQSLGVGALGRSVAAPRASSLVHPVIDRDGGDGEYMEGGRLYGSRRGSRLSSSSGIVAGVEFESAGGFSSNASASSASGLVAAAAAAAEVDRLRVEDSCEDPNNWPASGKPASLERSSSPNGSITSSFFSVSSPTRAGRRIDVSGGAAAALLAGSGDGVHMRRESLMVGGPSLRGDITFADLNRWGPRQTERRQSASGAELGKELGPGPRPGGVGERPRGKEGYMASVAVVGDSGRSSARDSNASTVPTGTVVNATGVNSDPRGGRVIESVIENTGGVAKRENGRGREEGRVSVMSSGSADAVEGDDPKAAEFVAQASVNREGSRPLRSSLASSSFTGRLGKDGVIEYDLPKKRPSSTSSIAGETVGDGDDEDDPMRALANFKLSAWPSSPDSSEDDAAPGAGAEVGKARGGNGKPLPTELPSRPLSLPSEVEDEDYNRDTNSDHPWMGYEDDLGDLEEEVIPVDWDGQAGAGVGGRNSPTAAAGALSGDPNKGVRRRGGDGKDPLRSNLFTFSATFFQRRRAGSRSPTARNSQTSAALAIARRRIGVGTARTRPIVRTESTSSSKPLIPWHEEWGDNDEVDDKEGSATSRPLPPLPPPPTFPRRRKRRFGASVARPPGEVLREASSSVSESTAAELMRLNWGMQGRVTSTGKKMKEGIRDAKETVRHTVRKAAKDLKREVGESVGEVTEAVKVLMQAGGLSGTGFVTFKSLAGRAAAISTQITNRPEVFNLTPAPEPRDIVWKNVTNHVIVVQNRRRIVNACLTVGIIFWSGVVSGIQALTTVESIDYVFPSAKSFVEKHEALVTGYVPVIILLVLIQTLYFILKHVALHLEGYKTYSEVERAVITRYFLFNLANVFVTIGAGSIDDAVEELFDDPRNMLNLLGERVPEVAVYFMNLIIVKVVAGLMLELCFGGRPLKFWRLLFCELFTQPGLRTKADRTRGSFEPSEPWYGRFFADFLLVLLVVFTFQVISPVVSAVGLTYFIVAEAIYKYQLMHCYWPMYESGGIFFHQLFRQMVVGAVAGHLILIGYLPLRGGYRQVLFLVPLPVIVLYFNSKWQAEGRRTSMSLSLDKAILQDNQRDINERDGLKPVWASFTPHAYMQPALLPGDPGAEFATVNLEDDSDVDADGKLELDRDGNVVGGGDVELPRRRRGLRIPRKGRRCCPVEIVAAVLPCLANDSDSIEDSNSARYPMQGFGPVEASDGPNGSFSTDLRDPQEDRVDSYSMA